MLEARGGMRRMRPMVSIKNRQLLAVCFSVLLCLPNVTEGRKVALSRVTKPTGHRGYANPDVAKLSYSPSHSAQPAAAKPAPPVYSAPPAAHPPPPAHSQPQPPYSAGPSYGWNVPGGHPPAGGSYGGAAVAGAAGTGIVAGNVYRSHGHNATGGAGGGMLAHSPPGYPVQPVQGFPGAPVQHPGGGFPAPGYQPQPGGYYPQQQPSGFPHQPGYAPQGAGAHYDPGHYQGHPGQTAHHYEQPSSGGSGIGTILGAGAAGLAAGVGGAALYDALKPKEAKEEPATTTTVATTVAGAAGGAAETPAPVPAAAAETPVPLAPMPANPNGDAPLAPMPVSSPTDTPLAPMPTEGSPTSTDATSPADNPLGMAPLATIPDSAGAASSVALSTDGTTTTTPSADVEVRHSALNVQPNLSATMAEPASGGATGTIRQLSSSSISLLALLPLIVKYLRF
ncbi:translation initiation factor IF-2-like [Anopheles albimanus]|uniref:translation initiation factor IF-2-like n=1 Tax=Anopheles albimanus TaxID=7167 RepID=UPI00164012E5|nr:translation initiation factor IF-2-like [Anopheles albimanus]